MNKIYLVNLDLKGNKLINAGWELRTEAPENPVEGQTYFDSTSKIVKYYTGSAWESQASGTQLTQVKTDLTNLTNTVTANKIEAADKSVVVTPLADHTKTTVKVNIKSENNDLKLTTEGLQVVPYTADGTTIELNNNKFKVKSGVFDAYGAATAAKNAVIGNASDDDTKDTVNGAKAFATKEANAALDAAKQYADSQKTILDGYTVNGKSISGNPVLSGLDLLVGGTGAHKASKVSDAIEAAFTANTSNLAAAKTYTDNAINALDVTDTEVDGQFVTKVTETNGKIAVSRGNILASKVKVGETNVAAELTRIENKMPAVAQGSGILVTPSKDETTGKITYSISTDTSVWHFKGSGYLDLNTRKMYKDSAHQQPITGMEPGDVYSVAESDNTHILYAWDGDEWIAIGAAEGVTGVDTTASEGIQLTQEADGTVGINATVAAADWTKKASDALAAAKTYANAIKVNGKAQSSQNITITGADIALTGYSKATSSSAIAAADKVNVAIGKLEYKADKGIADAAKALTDAKAYTDNQLKSAVGAGVHSYKTQVTTGSSYTVMAATHNCGEFPTVQTYLGNELVECSVSVSAAGDVTVAWNGSVVSSAKPLTIRIVG